MPQGLDPRRDFGAKTAVLAQAEELARAHAARSGAGGGGGAGGAGGGAAPRLVVALKHELGLLRAARRWQGDVVRAVDQARAPYSAPSPAPGCMAWVPDASLHVSVPRRESVIDGVVLSLPLNASFSHRHQAPHASLLSPLTASFSFSFSLAGGFGVGAGGGPRAAPPPPRRRPCPRAAAPRRARRGLPTIPPAPHLTPRGFRDGCQATWAVSRFSVLFSRFSFLFLRFP